MGLLKENQKLKGEIEGKIKAVFSELLECEEKLAVEYANEYLEKIIENKRHDRERQLDRQLYEIKGMYDDASKLIRKEIYSSLDKVKHRNIPDVITKGDILFVKYGVGYGDELRKGHYGIILARKGLLYLIAPLTKTLQPYGIQNITFVGLELPGEDPQSKTSYVSFNHIRYVHLRRLEKIQGLKFGKRHISDTTKLNQIIENYYDMMERNNV